MVQDSNVIKIFNQLDLERELIKNDSANTSLEIKS